MITTLCLLLLTLIPCTRAVIIDTQSLQILHTLPHAIIYVYDESPDESITPLLEETDIACFVVSRDVEPLKEHAYISTRGVMTPFHSEVTNMSIAYIIDRLPDVYISTPQIPASRPLRLINGNPDFDEQALSWCLHHDVLSCFDVDSGPLEINGNVWDGTQPDTWFRNQLVPRVIDLTNLDSPDLLFTGLTLFDSYLYMFTEQDISEIEQIVDTFYQESEERYLILVSNQITVMKTLFPHLEMPGIVYLTMQPGHNTTLNTTLNGEISVAQLHAINT